MSSNNFSVIQADWQQRMATLREIREAVFIIEQRVPKALEWDDQDETALHVLAMNNSGNGIGTARITRAGQIGRMAVLADWRNLGVGSALLVQLLQIARTRVQKPFFLNAQKQAIPFYLRHGFYCVGDEFVEAGIPHQRMEQDTKQQTAGQETP